MIRAAGRAGRLVAFDLLEHSEEPVSARAVARRTGLATPSVNDILRFLRFHGALTHGNRPKVRWNRLAALTSSLRLPYIVPARSVRCGLDIDEINQHLNDAKIPHTFAFTTAANRWSFFEPDPSVHVVVGLRQAGKAAKPLEVKDSPEGKAIHIYEDELIALRTEMLRGFTLTSRLQTWIDLKVFPHAEAHAAFFKQVIQRLYPEARSR